MNNLRNTKQWVTWSIHTPAQARSQRIDESLDTNYNLTGIEEGRICDGKQKFMFTAFVDTLITDKGKALPRNK